MDKNSSLLISAAKLSDQRTFTCMVVTGGDVFEYPVNVLIHSESELAEKLSKCPHSSAVTDTSNTQPFHSHCFFPSTTELPAKLEISGEAEELEIGRLTKVEFLMINILMPTLF